MKYRLELKEICYIYLVVTRCFFVSASKRITSTRMQKKIAVAGVRPAEEDCVGRGYDIAV